MWCVSNLINFWYEYLHKKRKQCISILYVVRERYVFCKMHTYFVPQMFDWLSLLGTSNELIKMEQYVN